MSRDFAFKIFAVRHPEEVDPRLFPSGLFSWVEVFNKYGKRNDMDANISKSNIDGVFKGCLEDYDIVMVNITPSNISYAMALREALGDKSSTTLVGCVDFGTMMWDRIDPYVVRQAVKQLDLCFHVEQHGAERLRKWTGKDVAVIPHPVDVEEIKKGFQTKRLPIIACQYHRYLNTWCEYFYPLRRIKEEYDVRLVLMNFEQQGKEKAKIPIFSMFDDVAQRISYRDYLHNLCQTMMNVDITYDHTYGRGIVEAAALGVPTIGSNTIEAARFMYGVNNCVTPGDDESLYRLAKNWLDNYDVRNEAGMKAFEFADYYSHESSYERLIKTLEERNLI
jgi:glycosyltransferase involved in cell wall biosynthesis